MGTFHSYFGSVAEGAQCQEELEGHHGSTPVTKRCGLMVPGANFVHQDGRSTGNGTRFLGGRRRRGAQSNAGASSRGVLLEGEPTRHGGRSPLGGADHLHETGVGH